MPLLLTALCMAFASSAQFNRTIDEELLSEMVLAKQEEVKKRFLKNFIRKNIKMTNDVTYNTMYDIVDILLTEKNKTAMTSDLVHKVADYSITYAATWYFIRNGCKRCKEETLKIYKNEKQQKENKPSRVEQAGFSARGSLFAQLDSVYSATQSDETKQPDITIDGTTDFRIGLHNWLLDAMYQALDTVGTLKDIGLFAPDEAREWQWDTAKYSAFWSIYKTERRNAIQKELAATVTQLSKNLVDIEDLASAVGLREAADLKALNLRSLGDRMQVGVKLTEDSIRRRIVETSAKFLADTSDASRRVTASTLVMLDEVLSSVRAGELGGKAGNAQIGTIFKLFLKSVELFRNDLGQNSIIARIADIIAKYVITDPEKEDPLSRYGFAIDVEAIILALEDRLIDKGSSPSKRCLFNLRPFMTIGLNYGYFGAPSETFEAVDDRGLEQVAWAGEKIGLKWRIWDWKYTRGQPTGEWFMYHGSYHRRFVRPREPVISNWHASLYASGLLYNIADLRTDETFGKPVLGLGSGVTFFNGMEMNLSYAGPIVVDAVSNGYEVRGFANVGFDIPIFEYIRAARAKRGG